MKMRSDHYFLGRMAFRYDRIVARSHGKPGCHQSCEMFGIG